jgi:hypothetical protein
MKWKTAIEYELDGLQIHDTLVMRCVKNMVTIGVKDMQLTLPKYQQSHTNHNATTLKTYNLSLTSSTLFQHVCTYDMYIDINLKF